VQNSLESIQVNRFPYILNSQDDVN